MKIMTNDSSLQMSGQADRLHIAEDTKAALRGGIHDPELVPGYWFGDRSALYLNTTERKISLYRRHGLLKFAKFGKNYVYRKEWLDEFAESWAGYDLSNEDKVKLAIREKDWRAAHGMEK